MITLIHRTNYWGTTIDSSYSRKDRDLNYEAIWAQALIDNRTAGSRGFGPRRVEVSLDALKEEHDGKWSLYYVKGTQGNNPDHFFYKFALIPSGARNFDKRRCSQNGWRHVGDIDVRRSGAFAKLQSLLDRYADNDTHENVHVHLGLKLESLDAPKGNFYQ